MGPRILLLDDDPQVTDALSRILRKKYATDASNDPLEAIGMLMENGDYDMVISDLMMPTMDGIEFFAKVKQTRPDTIRIMLTGYATMENAAQAVNEGHIFKFLTKPCSPEQLYAAVEMALEQKELIETKREVHSLRKLKAAFTKVVAGLAAAVESKDRYTAGHQGRVSDLGVAIAGRMGLDDEKLETIRLAGLVHDIGKIYVPAEFLCKPGPISQAEFAVIKEHPRVGFEIIQPMDFTWPISSVVLQHHERMDGSGYPQGLKGGEIMVESRVISVADVVDAIVSDRPYRRGCSLEEALKEIASNKGTKYDPDVAEALLDLGDLLRRTYE